jgi:hypothetical protein
VVTVTADPNPSVPEANLPSDCGTALTADKQTWLDSLWDGRVAAAWDVWAEESEADARDAEVACYQEILDALKAKCPSP